MRPIRKVLKMTNNWFSNFYKVLHSPPAGNLVEKAAFAGFGKEWFFQHKAAERIESGKKLYETLCRDKEARALYSSLVTGVTGVVLEKKAKYDERR